MSKEITWAQRLTLEYQGKKPEKTTDIPGTPRHEELQKYVTVASSLLKPGDANYRNYLAARITFVVSDRGQEANGDHQRTTISFNFKIPQKGLFNSNNLSPQLNDPFAQTGYHTEQVLYEYLKSAAGQDYLLSEFQKAEKSAVEKMTLKPLKPGEQRKVYAMVLDMHSSMNMCSLNTKTGGMQNSCSEATVNEQKPGKANLRFITAKTFRDNGYVVSGYNSATGKLKAGKIGLKMATRLSSSEIYAQDKAIASKPQALAETALNRHVNELVINKKIPAYNTITDQDLYDTKREATILKSSSKTGLAEAFSKYMNGLTGATSNGSIVAIRGLILAFPNDMASCRLIDEVLANDALVNKYPNILTSTIRNLENTNLSEKLLDAFIRTNNYERAIKLYCEGVTLHERNYDARNAEGVAFVCFPDIEGRSILWAVQETAGKQTFDKMVEAAKLTKQEIEASTGSKVEELRFLFQGLTMEGLHSKSK